MRRILNSTHAQRIERLGSLKCYKEFDNDFIHELAAKTQLVTLQAGQHLFYQGDIPDALYIVIEGDLQMVVESRDQRKSVVKEMRPGDTVGLIGVVAGGKRNCTVFATKDTTLAELGQQAFEELQEKFPELQDQLLDLFFHRLRRTHLAVVLPEYFKVMDEATFDYMESLFEWIHLKRGQALFKKGDVGDSLYILINGLLHEIDEDTPGKSERILDVVFSGQTVGEMALLSDEVQTTSTYAVRDSDLVKLSRAGFESISEKYPEVMMAIARILVDRLRHVSEGTIHDKNNMNIAVLPIVPGTRNYDFCDKLADALNAYGSITLLTAKRVDQLLNKRGISEITKDDPRDTGLRAWLANMEASHSFTIYMGEYAVTPWTKRCLSRADQVILLADANAAPEPSKVELELFSHPNPITEPDKILVFLHPENTILPYGTDQWLASRDIRKHYHARIGNRKDFSRIARILSHRAVGLALGGGAAKGIAHIGVIRALEEAGIPIDMIGGASMGSIIGALYAKGMDYSTMLETCRRLFIDMNPFNEYTLPIISLMRGKKLERLGKWAYGDSYIEDLWLTYFCVSSNLTTSRLNVHNRGLLRDAVRTSSSVPGVVSPVIRDGAVYVDGGVINNLPGDIILQQCGRVMVVEVVPNLDLTVNIRDIPSPWKILWSKLCPFMKPIKIPNILEIMFSTIMTGSFMAANAVKSNSTLCLTPPLQEIGFMDFKKMHRAVEIGYNYTKETLEKLDKENLVPLLV